jgi:hypothetical protein
MFRKLVLALGASAVIGAAALSPTAASAHGWHHHGWHHGWHHGFRVGFFAPPYLRDCHIERRVVWTRWGKRIRRVEVCY